MYDPSVGRWLEQDPIGFDAGDADLYRYVGNNPTNAIDPSGLDTVVVVDRPIEGESSKKLGHGYIVVIHDNKTYDTYGFDGEWHHNYKTDIDYIKSGKAVGRLFRNVPFDNLKQAFEWLQKKDSEYDAVHYNCYTARARLLNFTYFYQYFAAKKSGAPVPKATYVDWRQQRIHDIYGQIYKDLHGKYPDNPDYYIGLMKKK
ncbi:MAG TPA: RHS repeat-associated core domain-containing protein [Gemmataceae bacterium]|nr:RHS repeat-associated core domain-containing protein [Gemmataceae bacterium]